jgi:sigma-E factor negative regulatory protein RseB
VIALVLTTTGREAPPPARAPRGQGRVARLSGVLLCAVVLAASQARAQSQAASAPSAAFTSDLRGWLVRIHDAASRSNYVGTLVNSTGSSVISSRVAHYSDGHNELERVDALDGETRGMLRINDEVRTLWPRYRVVVVEPVDPRASFPSLVSGSEKHIPDFYELQVQASERIAGHDADRLLLKARDGDRFDHVIWADRATGLLLRVDVQVAGRTLESSGFSDVLIGVRPDPRAIYGELHQADGYHVVKPVMEPTKLEAEGWEIQLAAVPPGFQSLGSVRRMLPMPGTNTEARVLQTIFSDGLTHVSLFIEQYQPQRHRSEGLTVIGATHTLTRREGDWWITALGDVPPATLDQFVRALDRKP